MSALASFPSPPTPGGPHATDPRRTPSPSSPPRPQPPVDPDEVVDEARQVLAVCRTAVNRGVVATPAEATLLARLSVALEVHDFLAAAVDSADRSGTPHAALRHRLARATERVALVIRLTLALPRD